MFGFPRKPAVERLPDPTVEQLLTFEGEHQPGRHTGVKDEQIRAVLRITPVRYYVLLGRSIWLEDALRIDAQLTNRLRRIALERQAEHDRRRH